MTAVREDSAGRLVTVCDACLRAACWHGIFMCDEARDAGTVEKTVAELRALKREHSSYYSVREVERVCGGIPRRPA